jgi:uncharacterized membrane protein (UPF0127 family)
MPGRLTKPLSTLVFALMAASAALAQGRAPLMDLSAGIHRIETEVASTYASRAEGLMHRRSMPANRGMLFVFPEEGVHCMWMRNTLIPLAAAFIGADGTIINIAEMQPRTETSHCALRPAKYVLEMNGGWFKGRGIAPGSRLTGLEKAPPGR